MGIVAQRLPSRRSLVETPASPSAVTTEPLATRRGLTRFSGSP
jgi:hypothetical protein